MITAVVLGCVAALLTLAVAAVHAAHAKAGTAFVYGACVAISIVSAKL